MKYALKPSSRVLDVNGSNKLIFFQDEKQLINFFHRKMKQDLLDPVVKSERYNWRDRNKPNDIAAGDLTGIYSLLVSSNVSFEFLSWSNRVARFVANSIGKENYWSFYKILRRMRSLPFNWTLYTLQECNDGVCNGFTMKNIGWGPFFKMAKKNNLFDGIDLTYKIPLES